MTARSPANSGRPPPAAPGSIDDVIRAFARMLARYDAAEDEASGEPDLKEAPQADVIKK